MELPSFVQLEPVGQCNLRCRMCPIQYRRDGPPWGPPACMDFGLYLRLLDELIGLRELHLQGLGEPMMHPRFFDMAGYAAERGIKVSVNSNCTLLSPARAERLVACGIDSFYGSIDGATRATYEDIRVGGRFIRALRGLKLLQRAKARLRSPRPRVTMVTVVMRRNLGELSALVRLAARLELPALFVQHLAHDFLEESLPAHYRPMREYVDRETLLGEAPARVSEAFAAAREEAAREGVELRLPRIAPREHPPGTPGRERCSWPWDQAYVAYDGRAMPCCMVATPDRSCLGDAARDGFAAVWNGSAYEGFREALGSDEPPPVCRSCSVYRHTF